jgi:putative membrane protein
MSIRNIVAAATLVAAPMLTLHAQVSTGDTARRWPTGTKPVPTTTSTSQARSEAVNDSAFIRQAMAGNVLEVRLGRAAQLKATNPAVKQFGQKMVTDHSAMQSQWIALASKNGLNIKPTLDPSQEQDARQREQLSGTAFDQAYMRAMLEDHQRDLSEFQREGRSADSPEVRQLATSGASTINEHLALAQQVAGQIGINTSVAVNPSPSPAVKVRTDQNKDVREDLKDFVHDVADNHLMQVQMGQVAQRRSKNSDLRKFAKDVTDDFNKWQDRWTDLAKKNGFAFEPALGPMHKHNRERVENASEANFDRVYLRTMIDNLQSVVSDFQNEGRKARSAQVRDLVNDELHLVQQHLSSARDLQDRLNTRAEASNKNRKVSDKK